MPASQCLKGKCCCIPFQNCSASLATMLVALIVPAGKQMQSCMTPYLQIHCLTTSAFIWKYLPALPLVACDDPLKWTCTWRQGSSHNSSAPVGAHEWATLLTLIPIACPTLPIDSTEPLGRGCLYVYSVWQNGLPTVASLPYLCSIHRNYRAWSRKKSQRTLKFLHVNSHTNINEVINVCKECDN